MQSVLSFICSVDVRYALEFQIFVKFLELIIIHLILIDTVFFVTSPNTYILHQELLNFMLIAMSTQLLSGPSPRLKDVNPFLDAAIAQVAGYILNNLIWS